MQKKKHKFLLMFLILSLLSNNNAAEARTNFKCNSAKECQNLLENTARKFLGASYGYGSSSGKSFDCSGLIITVINSLVDKTSLPRNSQAMYSSLAQSVTLEQARRGDLVFFNTGNGISHVGMYWSKDNKGNHIMYHSSSSKGVEMRPLNGDNYWMPRLVGVKRFSPLQQALSSIEPLLPPKQKEKLEKTNKNIIASSQEKPSRKNLKNNELMAYYTQYEEPIIYEEDMYETAYYYSNTYKVSYEDETEYYTEEADEYEVAFEE